MLRGRAARPERDPRDPERQLEPLTPPEGKLAVVRPEQAGPQLKVHGKSATILSKMLRAFVSGGSTIDSTVDLMVSMPGTLLSAGFAACWEPLPRRVSLRRPPLFAHYWRGVLR